MRDGEKFRLGDLCSITKGETPIKQAVPGQYPLVVTAAERASHETFQFDCKAVIVPLVSSTGHGHASIKRINYQEGKFALGSILCAVIPKDKKLLSAKFLHVYFSYFKDQLIVPLMKGSANVSLSVGTLAELKIIVPPMDVQERVIGLAENDALLKPLEHEITHQETLLTKLKQAILQEAIAGKLTADWRAAHPDVEPASQLLHRIQAEKARLIAAKKLRPEKPLPKITTAEILFEIPQGWEWCRIVEATLVIVDCPHSTPQWTESGMTCAKTGQFQRFHLDLSKRYYVSRQTYEERVERLVPKPDDILYSREGGILGIACRIPAGEELCLGQRMMLLRPHHPTSSAFIELMLNSPHVTKIADASILGGCAPHINVGEIKAFPIPLPPLAEQAAIVERVEALMTTCRALEAEIAHARTHAAHLLQAVLKEAFAPASGNLDSVPPAQVTAPIPTAHHDALTALIQSLRTKGSLTSSDAQTATDLDAAGVRPFLQRLVAEGHARVEGQKRGTRYVAIG